MNLIKYLTLGLLTSAGTAIAQSSNLNSNHFHPCNEISYNAARKGATAKPRFPVYKTENDANSCHPFNRANVYVDDGRNYKKLSIYKVDHSLGQFNPARKDCAIESVQAGFSNEFSSPEKFKQCPPSKKKDEKFYVRTKNGKKKIAIDSTNPTR